jgi:plasmid stability protein
MTVRQIDDDRYDRLRTKARLRGVSAESLARDAIHEAAALTTEEKLSLVAEMQEWSVRARVAGTPQTLGIDLIREARDE